jgi:hypothetical protein
MDPGTEIVTITSTDLLTRPARIFDDLAEHTSRRFVVTRWHKPYAVLVSPEWHAEAVAALATVRAAGDGTEPGGRPRLRETEHGDE